MKSKITRLKKRVDSLDNGSEDFVLLLDFVNLAEDGKPRREKIPRAEAINRFPDLADNPQPIKVNLPRMTDDQIAAMKQKYIDIEKERAKIREEKRRRLL